MPCPSACQRPAWRRSRPTRAPRLRGRKDSLAIVQYRRSGRHNTGPTGEAMRGRLCEDLGLLEVKAASSASCSGRWSWCPWWQWRWPRAVAITGPFAGARCAYQQAPECHADNRCACRSDDCPGHLNGRTPEVHHADSRPERAAYRYPGDDRSVGYRRARRCLGLRRHPGHLWGKMGTRRTGPPRSQRRLRWRAPTATT